MTRPTQTKRKPLRTRTSSPFAANFKATRERLKLTNKAAAGLAGVAPAVAHGWENGAHPQDMAAVARFCKKTGVDFQWLLTGEKSESAVKNFDLSELFDIENDPQFSGVFLIEAKRLKRRKT